MRLPLTNYFATAVLIKREVLAAVIISLKHIYIYIYIYIYYQTYNFAPEC